MAITGQTITNGLCNPVGGISAINNHLTGNTNKALAEAVEVGATAVSVASIVGWHPCHQNF